MGGLLQLAGSLLAAYGGEGLRKAEAGGAEKSSIVGRF
jgi:hypothetical protein